MSNQGNTEVATAAQASAATTQASADIMRDRAVIVRNSAGVIRRMKSHVQLDIVDGTMVMVIPAKKKYKDMEAKPPVYTPSAQGYMKEASACGLMLDHPDTVVVGDRKQPNGYCDHEIGTYYFRTRCGGFTANGQPFITDRTVDFNVQRYNLQDMFNKAKQREHAKYFVMLPEIGEKDGRLLGAPGDKWAGYRLDGGMILWADCSAPDMMRWQSEMNNRAKNAIRIAQTFADRNAIAAHPAIPNMKKFSEPSALLVCTQWVATEGRISFSALLEGNEVEFDEEAGSLTDEETRTIHGEMAVDPTSAADIEAAEQEEEDPDDFGGPPAEGDRKALLLGIEKMQAEGARGAVARGFASQGIPEDGNLLSLGTPKIRELHDALASEVNPTS